MIADGAAVNNNTAPPYLKVHRSPAMRKFIENKPYDFTTPNMSASVLKALRNGKYPVEDKAEWERFLKDTGNADRVLAVLEYPTIDVELEMWTKTGGDVLYASKDDCKTKLSYFICIKGKGHHGEEEWESDTYAENVCEVDFSSPTWREALEEEMDMTVRTHANQFGYSLTEPNF